MKVRSPDGSRRVVSLCEATQWQMRFQWWCVSWLPVPCLNLLVKALPRVAGLRLAAPPRCSCLKTSLPLVCKLLELQLNVYVYFETRVHALAAKHGKRVQTWHNAFYAVEQAVRPIAYLSN